MGKANLYPEAITGYIHSDGESSARYTEVNKNAWVQLSLLWGGVSTSKENTLAGVMSYEEEEGVVCFEGSRTLIGTLGNHDRSGSSSLSSLFIYLHESLVDNL